MRPQFSVIIPTYNRAALLPRAIDSVLGQTFGDFELLIVDDGSSDGTDRLVGGYSDRRVRYARHETNLGQDCALNTGLGIARGEYVSFLDSDDEWFPTMLEKVSGKFRSDEAIGCVYTAFAVKNPGGSIEAPVGSTLEGYIYAQALGAMDGNQGSPPLALSVKRACFDIVGPFEPGVCIDDIICLKLAKAFKFGRVDEVLATMHCDAATRVTDDVVKAAHAYYRLYNMFASDVVEHCGRATMARYLRQAGEALLRAGERRMALEAFRGSLAYGGLVGFACHFAAISVRRALRLARG